MPTSLTLKIDLLGVPVFAWNGRPIEVDTRKALAVLAVLACRDADHAGPAPRDLLASMLWPDVAGERARGNLRRTLSVLSAATHGDVEVGRTSVALRAGAVASDVITLRQLARSQERKDLVDAVALVRGEFMAGFNLRACEPFDSWTAAMSETLRRELAEVLDRLVRACLRSGELHAALAAAGRWLELDPLHEPAHRLVMKLLSWTGRREEALDQYRRCVRVMADELGVPPVRTTTAVYDAIRTGTLERPKRSVAADTTGVAARNVESPSQSARLPLVGREVPMTLLHNAFAGPRRLILVTGENGVGRTRLVEELAEREGPALVAQVHEGEAAQSFSPITALLRQAVARSAALRPELAGDIARVLPEVLPLANTGPAALDSPGARDRFFEAVLSTIAGADARAVIVEDVHLMSPSASEVLAYLVHRMDQLPGPLVLTWRDPGLPLRHPVRRALTASRLTDRTVTVALARLTAEDVAILAADTALDPVDLFRETAGLPLLIAEAIRAGRTDILSMPVRDLLAARLAETSELTGQVLGALAVLGGIAETRVIRATSGRSDIETVDAIDEALRVGLVREKAAGVAFTHDALRVVADDQLSLARRRLLHARAAEAVMSGPDATLRSAQIAQHLRQAGQDGLAAEWAWTAARGAADLYAHREVLAQLDFVIGVGRDNVEVALLQADALTALGRYSEALVALDRGAALTAFADAALRARIERRAAEVHIRAGEWELADAGLSAAEAQLKNLDEDELLSQVLAHRALVTLRGHHADEQQQLERAQAQLIRAGRLPGADRSYVQNVEGLMALRADDPARAKRAFRSALDGAHEVAMKAALTNNLSLAQAAAGEETDAVASAREALTLGQLHGDRHRLAALHSNLADRLHDTGDTEAAGRHISLAAALFAEVSDAPLERPDVWTLTSW